MAPALLRPLAAAEDGFVSLFDGKSLNGWSIEEGPESAFYVKGGDIVIHEGSNFPTWLRSDKRYENFDFRCEFFVKGWSNSGIYLRGRYEVQIEDDYGMEPEAHIIGSVYGFLTPAVNACKALPNVTLEPLTNAVDEEVDVVFLPAAPGPLAEGETDEDAPEPLVGGRVDLGVIATEFLMLGIDPYPRKEGASFDAPVAHDDTPHPFAALAALKKDPPAGS